MVERLKHHPDGPGHSHRKNMGAPGASLRVAAGDEQPALAATPGDEPRDVFDDTSGTSAKWALAADEFNAEEPRIQPLGRVRQQLR